MRGIGVALPRAVALITTTIMLSRINHHNMEKECIHLKQAREDVSPKTPEGCEECLQLGDTWVHLRLCLTCGHVGCCDSSKNKHATKHFHATQHPIIQSIEPGEDWRWCYVDELLME